MFRLPSMMLVALGLVFLTTTAAPTQDKKDKDYEARMLKAGAGLNAVPLQDPKTKAAIGLDFTNNDMFGDAEIKEVLKRMPDLKGLNLGRTKVSNAGMKDVGKFQELIVLRMLALSVKDDGAKELAALKNLQELDIRVTDIGAAGIKELAGLKKLEKLAMNGRLVTDDVAEQVAKLAPLKELELSGTVMSGAGVKHLAGLKNLKVLGFGSVKIDDNGYRELGNLTQLEKLTIPKIKPPILKALQDALPKTKIEAR